MDSPEPPSNSTLSSGPAQDSPVFSYISNLSPIQPVEGTPAVQGFPGLNSPPLVFTSPRLNAHSRSSILKRSKFPQLSSEAFSGKNEDYHDATTDSDGTGVAVSHLRRGELSPLVQEEPDNNISVHEFLVDGSHFESTNPSIEVADNTPQPPNSAADKKESFFIFGSKEGARKNEIPKDAADVVEQAEENKGKSLPEQKDIGAYSTNTNSDLCAKVEPCFSVDSSLHRHYDDQFMDQADHTLQDIQSKPLEVAHDCIKDSDRINAMSIELDESNVQRDSQTKAGQHQSGISRRCLQFEDSQQMIAPTSSGSQNTSGSRPPVNPVVSEVVEAKSSEKIEVASSSDKIERCSAKVPKPSGIGLHLNRLVNAMQAGSGATLSLKSAAKGNLSIRGKKLTSMMSFHPLMVSSNVVESSLTSGSNHGSNISNAESFAALSLNNAKPSNDVVLWKPTEHTSSHESSEIDNQSTSNKKRKKPSDGGGCKRCNCKKTKCLKLYCDCFAAGIYCLDSCTCQGCFNRPEYEDTVLDVRQQIQSRNPLAFAPKIVRQHPTDSPATIVGDGASFTPCSARHKRGCNCKKSMCLKKYCECYQANVGCSNGCRCEGCQNVHGRKEEYGRDSVNIHCITEGLGTPDEDKVEKVTATSNQCNLTPLTPSFQCSNHVKTLSRSWFTSPESGQAACGLSSGSPRSSKNHDREQETSSDVLDLVTCDQELSSGDVKLANEFSRGFYVPGNMDDLLTLQKSQDWASNSGIPLPVHFQCARPLCLTQFDGSAMNTPELLNNDKKPYVMEDETPEILKGSSILVKGVKVSSPNKKRVSPPHCHLNELGSGESLKSGRKFILRAVPSFPPLTPCIDSKDEGTDSFVKR